MKKSILSKLLILAGVAILFVTLVSLWFSIRQQTAFMQSLFDERARQLANAFESSFSLSDLENHEELQEKVYSFVLHNSEVLHLEMWRESNDLEVELVASSNVSEVGLVGEQIHASSEHKHEISLENIGLFNTNDVVITSPWHVVGKHFGSYRVILTTKRVREKFLQQVYISAGAVLVGSVLVLMLFGLIVRQTIVKRLKEMISGVNVYGSGKLDYRIKDFQSDEISILAKSFNSMAEKLQKSQDNLQIQVDVKTKELKKTVSELENQSSYQDDTKKAMINLLEDAKDLEEDLKKEKEGVEKKVEDRTKELREQAVALEDARQKATSGWMQLQAEKARLNASMEAIPLGLVILNTKHEVLVCNSGFKKLIKVEDSVDVTLDNFTKFLNDSGTSMEETCPHCKEGGVTYVGDEILYGDKHLRVIAVPVRQEEKIIGSTYLVEDITETKLLQKTRDEFFSVASHELRTPLTAIRGNTQMLQDYYPEIQNNEEVKEMVTDIHSASVRLIKIVNDFLDASRLEMKKTEMKIESFAVKEILDKSMEEVSPQSVGRDLVFELKMHTPEDQLIKADKDRLQQVFINIIGNSLKFTQKGGVYIDVEQKENKMIKIKITDTGIGISKADQSELFAKFKQVGSNAGLARDVSEGTGMGLYISKLLMEAMGGDVYVDWSEEGKGTTFAIDVPVA